MAATRSGWSAINNSNTIWREVFARSEAVLTFMPAATLR